MQLIGATHWAIAEGYILEGSHGPQPQITSHETACILNTNQNDAHVEITLYFSDRDPVGPYRLTVPAQRTRHIRFNDLQDPVPVPRDTELCQCDYGRYSHRRAAYQAGFAAG